MNDKNYDCQNINDKNIDKLTEERKNVNEDYKYDNCERNKSQQNNKNEI